MYTSIVTKAEGVMVWSETIKVSLHIKVIYQAKAEGDL